MPNYTVLIFTRPNEGMASEFDEWYENTHLDDVIATAPGWNSGERFGLVHQQGIAMPNSHLAVYEAEAATPEEAVAVLHETRDAREISPAMDASEFAIWVFEGLGTRHERPAQ